MKKAVAAFLVFIFLLSIAASGHCYGPVDKFRRGVCNMVTWPMEIPNRIEKVGEDSGAVEAATSGLLQGIVMSVFRLGVGFYEALFFIVPVPERYEPILNDPEFFFSKSEAKK